MDKSDVYLGWIAKIYNELKEGLNKESRKCWSKPLDEDIFHDTIIKCIDTCKENELTPEQLKNYIFISYKRNYIREQEYARNKNRSDLPEGYDISVLDNINIDYEFVKKKVIEVFGEDEWRLFEDYIYGSKVSDIERDNSEKGLYYRFNKIKNYVKKLF